MKKRLVVCAFVLWMGLLPAFAAEQSVVFINLDPDAMPLQDYLEVLPEHARNAKLEERYVAVHIEKELKKIGMKENTLTVRKGSWALTAHLSANTFRQAGVVIDINIDHIQGQPVKTALGKHCPDRISTQLIDVYILHQVV